MNPPVTSFIIKGQLPGLNELIQADRTHWATGGKLKKQWSEICAWEAVAQGLQTFKNPIFLSLTWIEPNAKRDLDNIRSGVKFILDGLVMAGKIPNDTRKWVRGITDYFPDPDKQNPRIIIQIMEKK